MDTIVKRRWSITPVQSGVAVIVEQPAQRAVSPSTFVDMRKRNAAVESVAALGRMISAATLREVPRG